MRCGTSAVLLMTYGSPATVDDVPAFLTHVRGGSAPTEELIHEFRRRYEVIGHSPLLRLTKEQAAAVADHIGQRRPEQPLRVEVGMRHAPPFIDEVVGRLVAEGVRRIAGMILSPQCSNFIMDGYRRALQSAGAHWGVETAVAGPWYRHPSFVAGLAEHTRTAISTWPDGERAQVPVVFTAHSMPRRIVEGEPGYIGQLHETAAAVAAHAGLSASEWQFAYQSAGHTHDDWLRPDLKELFPAFRERGHGTVLVVPVQFLCDHLEILYDLDVAARAEAKEHGLSFQRIASLNCSPHLIEALVDVALDTVQEMEDEGARRRGACR